MSGPGISVAVPVGPYPGCKRWLSDCLDSVKEQLGPDDEVILVDDYARLPLCWIGGQVTIYKLPWRLGIAAAFNVGVAVARNDLVIMLGSDDMLLPGALEAARAAWARHRDPLGYYYFAVRYEDGEEQDLPCHAAMVTKALWKHTGGFPPESVVGAMDAAFVSVLLAQQGDAGRLIRVDDRPLYWVRRHPGQDTAKRGPWQGVILQTRDILTRTWRKAEWT